MSDRDALLAAIIREPAEDAPRLAFADLLDEAGEAERAAYIRYHIRGDPLPPALLDPSPNLEWVPPLPGHTRREGANHVEYLNGDGLAFSLVFSRGFVSEVRAPLSALMAHLPAIVRAHPVTRVEVTNKNPIGNPNDPSLEGWVRESSVDEARDTADVIPDELYDRLTGGTELYDSVQWTRYLTGAEARAALSVALIAIGKGVVV